MIALVGTEKQVAWAEQIRKGKIDSLVGLLGGVRPFKHHEEDEKCLADIRTYKNLIVQEAGNISSAKWWIDNRDMTRLDLLNWIVEHNSKVAKYKQDFYWRYTNDS